MQIFLFFFSRFSLTILHVSTHFVKRADRAYRALQILIDWSICWSIIDDSSINYWWIDWSINGLILLKDWSIFSNILIFTYVSSFLIFFKFSSFSFFFSKNVPPFLIFLALLELYIFANLALVLLIINGAFRPLVLLLICLETGISMFFGKYS